MVMIVLKWLLAMLLTLVPFVFHYCIKPKAASSDKWRNFYSFLSARMPWLKRKALAVKAWVSYVYHKMYRSDNGRKFFISVLVICLYPTHGRYGLSVQAASACSRDEKQVAQLGFLATGKECCLGAFESASQSSSVSQVDYIVEWLYLKEIFKW